MNAQSMEMPQFKQDITSIEQDMSYDESMVQLRK